MMNLKDFYNGQYRVKTKAEANEEATLAEMKQRKQWAKTCPVCKTTFSTENNAAAICPQCQKVEDYEWARTNCDHPHCD